MNKKFIIGSLCVVCMLMIQPSISAVNNQKDDPIEAGSYEIIKQKIANLLDLPLKWTPGMFILWILAIILTIMLNWPPWEIPGPR